jgi:hypothetical protein
MNRHPMISLAEHFLSDDSPRRAKTGRPMASTRSTQPNPTITKTKQPTVRYENITNIKKLIGAAGE